ncbi:iron-sulfur cluster assembly scaffold protein [Acidaminobacter sp. JC074]|uniref:iron-sulfur cluster assembly scaffold protein n=1 Tax=Acidaminobacter sp. JC074 TaxID=2530199 RepID=UPI001F0D47DE|nr:iron-sulfur cluster assembly scaffold protein [Acidaminobacter sp. JC074]MCH4890825.1 iron-sulfur cluster assembly scaffold protein [Acidaminobacter sp. JC074]
MEIYTDIVMEHLMNPKNVGILEDANGKGYAGDKDCGDYMELTLRIDKKKSGNEIIDVYIGDIKYLVHGCAGAIATSSMVSQLAKGKNIIDAYKLSDHDVIQALGGLPDEKVHCSLLGIQALREAILNFAENDSEMK